MTLLFIFPFVPEDFFFVMKISLPFFLCHVSTSALESTVANMLFRNVVIKPCCCTEIISFFFFCCFMEFYYGLTSFCSNLSSNWWFLFRSHKMFLNAVGSSHCLSLSNSCSLLTVCRTIKSLLSTIKRCTYTHITRVLRGQRGEVTGLCRKLRNENLYRFYSLSNIRRVIKSRTLIWASHAIHVCMGGGCVKT
jgi:hypothetical protein